MRAFLVDVNAGTAEAVDVGSGLDALYSVIGCDLIDIVTRNIDGRVFDIVCDDEGLSREPCLASAFSKTEHVSLVGNLLFCHHNLTGDLTDLSESDIDFLKKHLCYVARSGHPVYLAVRDLNW